MDDDNDKNNDVSAQNEIYLFSFVMVMADGRRRRRTANKNVCVDAHYLQGVDCERIINKSQCCLSQM